MTCQELVELVTEYLDGALPPAERDRFEEHLAECEGCRRHLAQVRATIRIAGSVAPDQLSDSARRDLLQAFRGWRESA